MTADRPQELPSRRLHRIDNDVIIFAGSGTAFHEEEGNHLLSTPRLSSTQPTTVISPAKSWVPLNLRELWQYRELLGFLVARDIKVKYKQTFLGIAWAVLQPFAYTLVFTLFFGRLAQVPSEGQPYALFSFTAMVLWTYFQTALNFSSTSLVTNAHLVSKIYFPRLLLPASASMAGLIDLLVSMVFLVPILIYYDVALTSRMFLAVPFILLALITALGVGMWLSAINIKYRDVQYTIPFLTQLWLFVSPVVYPSSMVPEKWRMLYGLNPMVAVIEGFKWAILPDMPFPSPDMMKISILISVAIFIGGMFYFRRLEKEFADVV